MPNTPSMDWTRAELDDHANQLGIDTTSLPNKEAVLDAINNSGDTTAKDDGKTGVLTYDNRQRYGVMQAATESERPSLRRGERRGNARAARTMKRR